MYSPSRSSYYNSQTNGERISEYSPLLRFPQYYDESGALVDSPSTTTTFNQQQSRNIYIKLFSLLILAALLLIMGGLIVFRSKIKDHNSEHLLPPIVFVPDLFCSDLEIRISHDELPYSTADMNDSPADSTTAALINCPLFLSEYTSIFSSALLHNHTSCLIAALTMKYDNEHQKWQNQEGVQLRVRDEHRKGVIVSDKEDEIPDSGDRLNSLEWRKFKRKHSDHENKQKDAVSLISATVDSLSPSTPCNYNLLNTYLHSLGYRDRHDLHNLPYDWRRSSSALLTSSSSPFVKQLKTLIESLHSRSNYPILFITHGAGTDHILAFLRAQPSTWKNHHIEGLIALGGDIAGNLAYLPAILTGYYPTASMFHHIPAIQMKPLYQTMEYMLWKLPLEQVYGNDYVVVEATNAADPNAEFVQYHSNAEDFIQMLEKSGASDMKQQYEEIVKEVYATHQQHLESQQLEEEDEEQPHLASTLSSSAASSSAITQSDFNTSQDLSFLAQLTDPFTPPPVNTMCLYPSGIPAISHYIYHTSDFSSIPTIIFTKETDQQTLTSNAESAVDDSIIHNLHMSGWRTGDIFTEESSNKKSTKKNKQRGIRRGRSVELMTVDNHAALGLICKHWSRVQAAAQQNEPNETQKLKSSSSSSELSLSTSSSTSSSFPHLLIGGVPGTFASLPAKKRSLRAIDSIIGGANDHTDDSH